MTPSLIVGLVLVACSNEPPEVRQPTPGVLSLDLDGSRRQHLERLRHARTSIEANIVLLERLLRDRSGIYTLREASRIRQNLEKMRDAVDELKQRERKLWEQQPGGITAPPPREKK